MVRTRRVLSFILFQRGRSAVLHSGIPREETVFILHLAGSMCMGWDDQGPKLGAKILDTLLWP